MPPAGFSAAAAVAAFQASNGGINNRVDCFKAVEAVMRASNPPGAWQCSAIYLFGACTPKQGGNPCGRCAKPPPVQPVPAGTRPAIKAACADAAIAALILQGG